MSRSNATPRQSIPKKTDQASSEDLRRLAGEARRGREVQLGEDGEHTFIVRPLKVKQILPFLATARPVFAALFPPAQAAPAGLPPAGAEAGQGGTPTEQLPVLQNDAERWLELVTEQGPEVLAALAIALEQDQSHEAQAEFVKRLEELEVVDLLVLVTQFVQVNGDFLKARGLTLPRALPSFGVPSPAAAK